MLRPVPAMRDGSPLSSQVVEYCAVGHESVAKIATPSCFPYALVQFWPSSGLKRLKMGQNGGFRSLSEKVFTQSYSNLMCTLIGWVFRIHINNGPLVTTKWLEMVVSDHYLKKYSHNPIQTWCVHLLGECSELIRFWAALAKCWQSSGHKMTEIGAFWVPTIIWKKY